MRWCLFAAVFYGVACDEPGGRTDLVDAAGDTVADTGRETRDAWLVPDGALGPGEACTLWNQVRADRREGVWTGSAAACDPGTWLEPGPSNTLAQVNLYRALAALPPVTLDPDKNAAAQACALIMDANGAIEHAIPDGWRCLDTTGVAAAGLSNLATTAGVLAVDLYMSDNQVDSLGHRRWILSSSLGPIGVGSTNDFSCLHVLDGDGSVDRLWTAWPPSGEVPIQALHQADWLDTDAAGWSIQSDRIDLNAGLVTVTRDGASLPVDVAAVDTGFGSTFALRIRPRGWRTEVGGTYEISVSNVSPQVHYSFTAVDCGF